MNSSIDFHPNNMPTDDYNSDRWARNTLCNLDLNDLVNIHFESEFSDSGEQLGMWEITLERDGKWVEIKHGSILQALWAAANQIEHEADTAELERQERIKLALSKLDKAGLTTAERQLLGISGPLDA